MENGIFPSPVRQVRFIMDLKMPFPEFIVRFEECFMLKEYENLTEAFKNVCKEFDVEPKQELLDSLVGMWNKNTLLSKPYPETKDVLEKLKKKHKLVLISNTDQFSVVPVLDKFELRKYFDEIVLSYEVGMLKTNPKMFEHALSKLKLKKEDVIMVGDSMETDIKGANNAGIKPVLIDRLNRRAYEDRIGDLKEIDGFLTDNFK